MKNKNKNMNIFADKKLKSIDIVFENCEVYTIPAIGIHRMSVGNLDFSFDVHVNGLSERETPGEIFDECSTDFVSLILNEQAFDCKSAWEEMFECYSLKERLAMNDITHFDFNFTDGTNLYVSVPWEDGEDEFTNIYQHTDIKDKMIFVTIYENLDIDNITESNENYYDFETYTCPEEDIEEFGYEVPNYVQAAFRQIDEELSRVMWNIHQEEFESPFDNTSNQFSNDVFEVEAYSWDDEYDQKYNFKWQDYKVRWYKHSRRDPEANRYMSPEECAKMLDECLESISKMDITEDNLFETENCVQCGKETNYFKLSNGKWACKECLDKIGEEQAKLKQEVENNLFDFGFDNYQDVSECLDVFIDILKYAQINTTVETLDHLITSLDAINTNIKLENNLVDEETKEKIMNEIKKVLTNN